MRALRGPGPLRLRREKRALKRSWIGWVWSTNRSQRNCSMLDRDPVGVVVSREPMRLQCRVVVVLKRQGCSGVVFVAVAPPRHPQSCKNLLLQLLQATCKEYDALVFSLTFIKLLINLIFITQHRLINSCISY